MSLHPRPDQRHILPPSAAALAATVALAAIFTACDRSPPRHDTHRSGMVSDTVDGFATGYSSSEARFVRNVTGFREPESVRYDPDQDLYFVSNMFGLGSTKDGNGFISRVNAATLTDSTVLVKSGEHGAVLDAPKGMAIQGDTLWVADIDKLRGFDRHTGLPVATIDFAPQHAVLLNDVAVSPDGTIWVTDTGIIMNEAGAPHTGPDRIFAVGAGHAITVAAEGPQLHWPNGVTWDAGHKRWLVVSFDPFAGQIAAYTPGDPSRHVIATNPRGNLDGIEVLPNGAVMYSSWADSSVHVLEGGKERQIIREVPVPADIGYDTRRNRVAIPLSTIGWVQVWDLNSIGKR